MPELEITIGGRSYAVACQEGEELHLQTAAAALNAEAETVVEGAGRIPESRMLLMAGLMLADKIAAVAEVERASEEKVSAMQKKLRAAEGKVAELEAAAGAQLPLAPPEPEAADDTETRAMLTKLAEELESVAETLEEEVGQ